MLHIASGNLHNIQGVVVSIEHCFNHIGLHNFQISEDEQSVDLLPNESAQLIEENRGNLQPGDERQPQVDVPIELSKLKTGMIYNP